MVGQPVDRIEAKLKTTGTATYAYEHHDVAPNVAYGYIVGAAIAKGRIASIDLAPGRGRSGRAGRRHRRNAGPARRRQVHTSSAAGGA